jgi:hypothetical protein
VKLPDMVAYSFRHKRPSNRISDQYGEYEPGYLREAAAALDAYLIRLQTHCTRRLFAGTAPAAANVENIA